MVRTLLAVAALASGCVVSPGDVFLEPGRRLDNEEVRLVMHVTIGVWEEFSGPVTPDQRREIAEVPVYRTHCEQCEDAEIGELVTLARCSVVNVDGEPILYIALHDFVDYDRSIRTSLPHEYAHKLQHFAAGLDDPKHEDWLTWNVVVPEANARVARALDANDQ